MSGDWWIFPDCQRKLSQRLAIFYILSELGFRQPIVLDGLEPCRSIGRDNPQDAAQRMPVSETSLSTTSPANTLEVKVGGTTLADAWTTRSSRRFKTNIQPLEVFSIPAL